MAYENPNENPYYNNGAQPQNGSYYNPQQTQQNYNGTYYNPQQPQQNYNGNYNQQQWQQPNQYQQQQEQDSTLAICALIFAFIIPLVGFILGIVGINKYPKGSTYRAFCKVGIIWPCVIVGLAILYVIFAVILTGAAVGFYY